MFPTSSIVCTHIEIISNGEGVHRGRINNVSEHIVDRPSDLASQETAPNLVSDAGSVAQLRYLLGFFHVLLERCKPLD